MADNDSAEAILAEMGEGEAPEEQTGEELATPEEQTPTESETPPEAEKTDERPPLPPEELDKRYRDQQSATFQERQRRRDAEERNQRLESQFKELMGRVGPQTPPEQQTQEPTVNDDPLAVIEQLQQERVERQRQEAIQAQQQQQYQQQAEQVQRLGRDFDEYEQAYLKEQPDYIEAVQHLVRTRAEQLQQFGMTNPEQLEAQVKAEVAQLGATALSNGRDPARAAYHMAKTMGYAPQGSNPQQRLANVRAGQAAAKTLSGGGKGVASGMTINDINELTGKEFDEAVEKMLASEL